MLSSIQTLQMVQKRKLEKAIAHLEYSCDKVKNLPIGVAGLDNETLETLLLNKDIMNARITAFNTPS